MLKIVDSKKETKKYMNAVNTFFKLYRANRGLDKRFKNNAAFYKVMAAAEAEEFYKNEPFKKDIIKYHLIDGMPLHDVAEKLGYSVSHVYNTHQAIIKDFAMLIFDVIIL